MAEKKGLGIAKPSPQPESGLVADLVRVLSALTTSSRGAPEQPAQQQRPPEQLRGLGRPHEYRGWAKPPAHLPLYENYWGGMWPTWSPYQMSEDDARSQVFGKAGKVGRGQLEVVPSPAAGPVGGELGPPIEPSASHQLQILLRALGLVGGGN